MLIDMFGEIGSILFMAFALGMDGFSVSLALGLRNLRLKRMVFIGFIVGMFHVILPLIGIIIGNYISLKLEKATTIIGGFILVFIGLHMMFSALQKRNEFVLNPRGMKMISVAFIVSIDSFPVGISLGLSGVQTFIIIFVFGFSAMILSWIGLLIGKKTHSILGIYSEILGGIILFVFGVNNIF